MPSHPVIYIVDDIEEHLEITFEMVTHAGFTAKKFRPGSEFLMESEISEIGCLLLDNQMPDITGLEVQAELNRRDIDLPIVFMSGGSMYAEVVDAVREGALGFLQKPFSMADLIGQVETAVDESRHRHDRRHNKSENARLLAGLTPREREVYELVVAGHTNKMISETLVIAVGTVEFHRANVMKKLKVTSLAGLMAIARGSDE